MSCQHWENLLGSLNHSVKAVDSLCYFVLKLFDGSPQIDGWEVLDLLPVGVPFMALWLCSNNICTPFPQMSWCCEVLMSFTSQSLYNFIYGASAEVTHYQWWWRITSITTITLWCGIISWHVLPSRSVYIPLEQVRSYLATVSTHLEVIANTLWCASRNSADPRALELPKSIFYRQRGTWICSASI